MLPELFSRPRAARGYHPSIGEPSSLLEDVIDIFGQDYDSRRALPIDIEEKEDEYKVTADLPGIARDDINVSLDGQNLTIAFRREEEKEKKGDNFIRCERRSGSAARTVHLALADPQAEIDARLKEGVLTLRVPKTEEGKMHRVEIK